MNEATPQTKEVNNSLVSEFADWVFRQTQLATLTNTNECDPALWFTHNGGSVPPWQRGGESLPAANSMPALNLILMKVYQIGLNLILIKVYQIGFFFKENPKQAANPLSKSPKFTAFKPKAQLTCPSQCWWIELLENHCPLGLCGPWSQSLSLLMAIWLKDCTGATVPLKHLPVGNDSSRCCHLEKHLAGLAFGPMVSMTRLEWSLLEPSSGQTIIKVHFQIELTLNFS